MLDGYHVGLLITTKNHKKFLEFFNDPQNAKLTTRDVSAGAKFADFNFFAINEKTGKGVFQYYHNSCSLNMFGMLCRSHYEQLKGQRLTNAINQAGKSPAKAEKAIRAQYSGTLNWEIVVRKEAFDRLIDEFKTISAITFGVSTLAYEETAFTPLSHLANKMIQRYTFRKGTVTSAVVAGIRKVIKKADVEGAKVEGIGPDNLERVVKLVNTPDTFGEFEFDKVADMMTLVPAEFVNSPFLKELIKVANNAPALKAHKK